MTDRSPIVWTVNSQQRGLTTLVMAICDEIRYTRETSITNLVISVILRSVPTEKVLEIKQEMLHRWNIVKLHD